MKAKELLYLLGIKPKAKKYGTVRESFELEKDGHIDYARWLHPKDYSKQFPQTDVDELRQFVQPGDVCIDIGAHGGDYTMPMALAAGPQGCVLAFEPNPYVYHVLEENSQLNRDKMQIIPLPFAATEEDGQIQFEYSDSGFCNGGRHQGVSRWKHAHSFHLTVDGRNVEQLLEQQYPELLERITFIKIDAEGYDLYVLKSMMDLVKRNRPFILAEMYKHMPRELRVELVETLRAMNYRIKRYEYSLVDSGEPEVFADNVMQWQHYDVFCEPIEKIEQTANTRRSA